MRVKIAEDVLVRIYELRDPRSKDVTPRYVGITIKDLEKRLYFHIKDAERSISSTHKIKWIQSLLRSNVTPTIHLIEEVIGWKYACEVEKYWIKEFREQGYNLTNSTDGGEGSINTKVSMETRKKLSNKFTGKNNPMYGKTGSKSPAWKRKLSKQVLLQAQVKKQNTLKNKGVVKDLGISYDSVRNSWISTLFINGSKYNCGTYKSKENAIAVINELFEKKYITPPATNQEIKEIISKHTTIEWCRKLFTKPATLIFKPDRNKWVAKISTFTNNVYIGIYENKEDAELAYWKKAKEIAENKLLKYTMCLKDINVY